MSAEFTIPAMLDGERVDRAVALLTGRSRSEVARLIEEGRVLLAGRPVSSAHARVRDQMQLVVDFDPGDDGLPRPPVPRDDVPFGIVHVDDAVVVIDKPAGVVVHPGNGHEDDTLVSGLLASFPDLAALAVGDRVLRPGIVHRLDKETSGLLVVARTERAQERLSAQLADRSMGREYRALTKGSPSEDEGVVDAPLGRSLRDPTKMAVRAEGRDARTTYRVLVRFEQPAEVAFLSCTLSTGRTHQIRVHLAAIGHPVVGDVRYGGVVRAVPIGRPFLHAARLRFVHPTTGQEVAFESPLPSELVEVLESLE